MWPLRRTGRSVNSAKAVPDGEGSAQSLGRVGERLARQALKRGGLKILAQNYRCSGGEADFIALDPSTRKTLGEETIVFVEVKTRSSDTYTDPRSAVNSNKQFRLHRVAKEYLAARKAGGYLVRFDVVSIVAPPGEPPRVEHIPDAFG